MAIQKEPGQKGVSWSNIAVGAIMNMVPPSDVTTLGQPLEVLKTQMAANRSQPMWQAFKAVAARGSVAGFYQGLIPWAWIEASTKGAVLIFTASEVETATLGMGISPAAAGLLGGMTGGVAQAYATMGFTTCMKTAEITRQKTAAIGVKPPSTMALFMDIYRREGLAGVNKGVNAVAVRQCTNWGSRMGFARLAETGIRRVRGKSDSDSLGAADKILASSIGGALATWNQPIEVVRIEVPFLLLNQTVLTVVQMQSMVKDAAANVNRPAKLTVLNTLAFVYKESGLRGLYRGVTPRIGLGIWQTVCMVSLTDYCQNMGQGKVVLDTLFYLDQ
ncbi:mitochondrial carrier domain-containing protein [Mycena amicta]|nr:mitochondrial carrier domain-containing protein [Mycena amicta]